jgi:hypothetical protein
MVHSPWKEVDSAVKPKIAHNLQPEFRLAMDYGPSTMDYDFLLYALRMIPKSIAIIAITKRIWIRPPPTG